MSCTRSGRGEPTIVPLPELVRNQIAAGEVIERPASVVKELIENALDAGASEIRVDLEEGGARLIRVTDDGRGMNHSDLALAFESHATSKLRDASDLDHISSLGFRGEALASIGSVARCSIYSRPGDEESGARIENEGGRISEVREAGGPKGTSVEIRDLFYNTPARRRFLKRTSTELSRSLEVVQRSALAQLGAGFVATHDGRRVYDVEAAMDLRGRIRRTFGAELSDSLVEVGGDDGTHRVFGFIAPPRLARRDSTRQMWFLNGRPVRDRLLFGCLKEACRGIVVDGRQAVAFLHLSMDPALLDVNVHPAKTEIRFRQGRAAFGFLRNTLREALLRTDMATPGETMLQGALSRRDSAPAPGQRSFPDLGARPPRSSEPYVVREVAGVPFEGTPRPPILDAPPSSPEEIDRTGESIVGPFLQIDRTYIVRALPDGFEVIDQHALHERITFEGLLRDMREGRVEVQRLLVPEVVEVSRAELELFEEHAESLSRIGIELAVFGKDAVAVNGLPARLRHPDTAGLIRDLADLLARTGKAPAIDQMLENVLHRAACRSSVMAGDSLREEEIRSLLERGRELESDQTCPHARPTRVRFTLAELEKAFGRR
jgi:DNA mismatch repair protein MutL